MYLHYNLTKNLQHYIINSFDFQIFGGKMFLEKIDFHEFIESIVEIFLKKVIEKLDTVAY